MIHVTSTSERRASRRGSSWKRVVLTDPTISAIEPTGPHSWTRDNRLFGLKSLPVRMKVR